jgi:hypothetical protein
MRTNCQDSPDARIANFYGRLCLVAPRFNRDSPTRGVNLCVLIKFQKTCWSRLASASTKGRVAWKPIVRFSFRVDLRLADSDRLLQAQVHVGNFAAELKFAASHAREIEEIIDEMGLQIQIAAHDRERAQIFHGVPPIGSEVLEKRNQRRERGAQLMGKHPKEKFFGGHRGLGQKLLRSSSFCSISRCSVKSVSVM